MMWFPLIKAEQFSLRLERRKRNMWKYRAHSILKFASPPPRTLQSTL